MSLPLRVRLTGRATRFVSLLQDFGHLDELGVDRLLVLVAEQLGGDRETVADLPFVRKVAAAYLFDLSAGDEQLPDLLGEDWPLLFH